MPIIVACPNCNGQLRVADYLIGQKVRCPACSSTFDAQESAPQSAPPAPPPVETVPVPAWRNLNLELTDDSPPKAPPPEEPALEMRNGSALKGAVEVDLGSGDPIPPAPPAPAESEKRKPRWDDREDEDERPCPVCRKRISRNAKRCPSCNERLENRPSRREEPVRRSRRDEDDDDYGIRRQRVPRRDCEPHRGGLVLTFGILSVALLTLFWCFLPAPLALGFGIAAWWMGQADLRKFRANSMDPDGEGTTRAGWICGIIGTVLNAIVVVGCGSFFAWGWYEDIQRSKQIKRQQFQPPMVTPKKF